MKLAQSLIASAAITAATLTSPAWAAKDQQHDSHHPTATVAAQNTTANPGQPMPDKPDSSGQPMPGMAGMGDQMKAMHEMHEKMMAAKTPEERNALMAEHRKVMQEGMAMMNRTGRGGMSGMQGDSGMPGMQGDMGGCQKMMEQRMDMMQSMMQMMMNRMGRGEMSGMQGGSGRRGMQGDTAARQEMMEQRMDMMQSMMQMMMDRMAPTPNPTSTPTPAAK